MEQRKIIAPVLCVIISLFLFNTTLLAKSNKQSSQNTVPVKMVMHPTVSLKLIDKKQQIYKIKFKDFNNTYTRILHTDKIGTLTPDEVGSILQSHTQARVFVWLVGQGGRALKLINITYKDKTLVADAVNLGTPFSCKNIKNKTTFVTIYKIDINKKFTKKFELLR